MEAEIQDFRCIRKLPCGLQFYAWALIQSLITHCETGALGRQKLQLAAHRCPSKELSRGSAAGWWWYLPLPDGEAKHLGQKVMAVDMGNSLLLPTHPPMPAFGKCFCHVCGGFTGILCGNLCGGGELGGSLAGGEGFGSMSLFSAKLLQKRDFCPFPHIWKLLAINCCMLNLAVLPLLLLPTSSIQVSWVRPLKSHKTALKILRS